MTGGGWDQRIVWRVGPCNGARACVLPLAPLASCLIEAVGDRDRELLDALEALVEERRRQTEEKP